MMKKTIRMILSLVLVLVLGATMLVACNKDKGEETPETHTYSTTLLPISMAKIIILFSFSK